MRSVEDIARLCAALPGHRVRIDADGTITATPVAVRPAPVNRPKPLTSTERMRRLRQRRNAGVTNVTNVTQENITFVTPEPEIVTDVTDVTEEIQESPSPPSPPPSPPTPSPSAPAAPTPPKGKRLRDEATGFAEACRVVLDLTASPRLQAAWVEWQQYRQRRHHHDKLEWSLQAARLTANQVVRYAESHGEQIVIDRITTAITGRWQGPNFDKLETPKPNAHTKPHPSRNSLTGPGPKGPW